MRILAMMGSATGLLLTVVPSCLVFAGFLGWQAHVQLMLAGMVLWFTTAPSWFKE